MKRYIHSSKEVPAGFLKTSKFTTPSIRTQEQRNALEAFEIAVTEKFDQFDKMLAIQMHLTSDTSWEGVIEEYLEGYYIKLRATRSSFQAFVSSNGVVRKPRNTSDLIAVYDVEGNGGTIYRMSDGEIRTKEDSPIKAFQAYLTQTFKEDPSTILIYNIEEDDRSIDHAIGYDDLGNITLDRITYYHGLDYTGRVELASGVKAVAKEAFKVQPDINMWKHLN